MSKRILIVVVLAAFAVCAVAVAQQRKAIDEARFGTVDVKRTHSHVMKPAGVLVVPWHINYQGYLTDDAGNPINDTLSMTFGIWDDPGVGSELWNENGNVVVEEGLFNVVLGSTTPIPSDVFGAGQSRWLELTIVAQTLSPRTEITSVGYAYRAVKADSADDAGMVDGFDASATPGAGDLFPLSAGDVQYVNEGQTDAVTSDMILDGTIVRGDAEAAFKAPYADTADYAFAAPVGSDSDWTISGSVLYPSGDYGLAMRSSNVLYGTNDSTHVNLGIACTTGMSGQNYKYCTVSGGLTNSAGDWYATVGGGAGNVASDWYATVGGGQNNTASGNRGTVGGGESNVASDLFATIAGGQNNTASGSHATVGGGYADTTRAVYGGVLSGRHNIAGDQPEDTAAVVAGGSDNAAVAAYSSVGGGFGNTATGSGATVAGGGFNTATDTAATVGGGGSNTANGSGATVAGGAFNTAGSPGATVSGGGYSSASSYGATVAGGGYNAASGSCATVGGGYADTVAGDYSFAAGNLVRVAGAADYTFAFGRDFTTSTPNAVIFHNSVDPISVGIGTVSPTERLDVDGTVQMTGFSLPAGAGTGYVLTSDASGQGAWQAAAGDNDWTITGTVLHPSSSYGLSMRSFNVLYGVYDTTHVNLGIACTTGTSGQDRAFCTVSGGYSNTASYDYAAVGGGSGNAASGYHGTVSGGERNAATGQYAVVGGGRDNTASGNGAAIGGGGMNAVNGGWAAVGGGWDNTAAGNLATVGGGESNTADSAHATVGGGFNNAAGIRATVAGGQDNDASGTYATVCGGYYNIASGYRAFVGGGYEHLAMGDYATVGGGHADTASGDYATVGGGGINTASGSYATVAGGDSNNAGGTGASVGGGQDNTASDLYTTVCGGLNNTASGFGATVGGGWNNIASGYYATVAGGEADTVTGWHSFAAGRQVRVTADYTFGFGRNFTTSTANAVIFYHSPGPVRVGIGNTAPTHLLDVGTNGAYCNGFTWVDGSSREYKEQIVELSSEEAIEAVSRLTPVRYNYKSDKDETFVGFIAEDVPDLVATKDRKGVSPMDIVAVLTKVVQEQQERIEALEAKIETMGN